MNKIKLLIPILGMSTITASVIPMASCGNNTSVSQATWMEIYGKYYNAFQQSTTKYSKCKVVLTGEPTGTFNPSIIYQTNPQTSERVAYVQIKESLTLTLSAPSPTTLQQAIEWNKQEAKKTGGTYTIEFKLGNGWASFTEQKILGDNYNREEIKINSEGYMIYQSTKYRYGEITLEDTTAISNFTI